MAIAAGLLLDEVANDGKVRKGVAQGVKNITGAQAAEDASKQRELDQQMLDQQKAEFEEAKKQNQQLMDQLNQQKEDAAKAAAKEKRQALLSAQANRKKGVTTSSGGTQFYRKNKAPVVGGQKLGGAGKTLLGI